MTDEVDYTRELELFCGPDEAAARTALDRLAPPARRYMGAVLADKLSWDDIDEVVQTSLLKAWGSRLSFDNRGRAAWFAWLKRIARNACVDLFRNRGDEAGDPIPDDIEDDELPLVERFMTEILGSDLFALADVTWLELDESCPPVSRDRCLLAVQLCFFEGWSLDDVLSLFSDANQDADPLSRSELDTWLEVASNLRWVAYHELLYSPERLTAHLLGLPPHAGAHELESSLASARSGTSTDAALRDWTAQEARAIIWHYYRGLTVEETASRVDAYLLPALYELFVRCTHIFPFRSRCESVCAWLDDVDVAEAGSAALIGSRSGLWRRLAFEYRYRYILPIRDIHDRIAPAACVVSYDVSVDVLNMWISGGRLLDKLRQNYEARQVRQTHA